jgi:hypothetical protein
MLTLKTLSDEEAQTLIAVKEATIQITVQNEGDEEEPDYWYQCDVFGLESELSGEFPDYEPDSTDDEEILRWVVKHEKDILGALKELKGVNDFVFPLTVNDDTRWVNLADFIEFLERID